MYFSERDFTMAWVKSQVELSGETDRALPNAQQSYPFQSGKYPPP
jgi:hypothetical protein